MLKLLIYYINRGYYLVKEMLESIALFGGSFDPPHLGHERLVEEALKVLEIDKLIVVPTFLNPFKSTSHYTPQERLALSKALFEPFEKVLVDDYEIQEGRATSTVQTLRHFQKSYNVSYVIIGADNLENIDQWKEFEYLNSQIIWVIARRSGYAIESDKLRDFKILNIDVDISSTQIRNNMKKES